MRYLVTNFAYGTGPYLRTTDLAIAFNNEFLKRTGERFGIIVPLVYGEKQRRIMLEEFASHESRYPGEIVLDQTLGTLLESVFYGEVSYEASLQGWIENADKIGHEVKKHLSSSFIGETLMGEKREIEGSRIELELNRAPRIKYNIAPSYFTSFAHIGDILGEVMHEPVDRIALDRELCRKGRDIAGKIESGHEMYCLSYPGTFTYEESYKPREQEIIVPPIGPLTRINNDPLDQGIFVTVTGIPGLERLYEEAKALGIRLYSNDPEAVPGSIKASPHVIPNKNILFQFARSGWSSVWLSMIAGTPLVVPDFDPYDDPEIYFNNKAVESLAIGIVYRGQPLKVLLEKAAQIKENQKALCRKIIKRWGTLDGTSYCAELFAKDFIFRYK